MRRFKTHSVAHRDPFAAQPLPKPVLASTAFQAIPGLSEQASELMKDATKVYTAVAMYDWNDGAAAFAQRARTALEAMPTVEQLDKVRSLLRAEIARACEAVKPTAEELDMSFPQTGRSGPGSSRH